MRERDPGGGWGGWGVGGEYDDAGMHVGGKKRLFVKHHRAAESDINVNPHRKHACNSISRSAVELITGRGHQRGDDVYF